MFSSQTGRKLAGGYVAEGLQSFLEGLGGLSVQHNAHAVVVSMRDDTFEVWTTTLPQALTFPQALDPGRWVEKLEPDLKDTFITYYEEEAMMAAGESSR